MIDFVTWFQGVRSDDVGVGITKVRQLTFQMRSTEQPTGQEPAGGVAGGVGGGEPSSGEESRGNPYSSSACHAHSANCFGCAFVSQLQLLPKQIRASLNKVLEPFNMQLPDNRSKSSFTSKYTNTAFQATRKKRRVETVEKDLQYKMTYKVSM